MWIKRFFVFCMMLTGFGVAVVSLYDASVTGLKNKIGLTAANYDGSYDLIKLETALGGREDEVSCNLWDQKFNISYLWVNKIERAKLGQMMAEARLHCGIHQILNGDTSKGTVTVLKGLRYAIASLNGQDCLSRRNEYGVIDRYINELEANSNGTIAEILEKAIKPYRESASKIAEVCID